MALLHLGHYAEAEQNIKQKLAVCTERKNFSIIGTCYLILGSLSIVNTEYKKAIRLLEKSIDLYQNMGEIVYASWVAPAYGVVARKLGFGEKAQTMLLQALEIGLVQLSIVPIQLALPIIALFKVDSGNNEKAVELYSLACTMPFIKNSQWFYDVVGKEMEQVMSEMPVNFVASAKARGKKADVWETAKSLLGELS
jgi:tetratricopeptide (TPR) repeat protein